MILECGCTIRFAQNLKRNVSVATCDFHRDLHARAEAMQTALERMLLYVTDQDAFKDRYGHPEFPESSINVEAWRDWVLLGPAKAALGDAP